MELCYLSLVFKHLHCHQEEHGILLFVFKCLPSYVSVHSGAHSMLYTIYNI